MSDFGAMASDGYSHKQFMQRIQFVLPTCRTVRGYLRTHSGVNRIRPLKLTWRIRFSPIERKIIFQTKLIFQGAPATHHISACTYDPTRDVPKYCTCREIQSPRVHTTLLTDAYSACTCDPGFRVYLRPPDLCWTYALRMCSEASLNASSLYANGHDHHSNITSPWDGHEGCISTQRWGQWRCLGPLCKKLCLSSMPFGNSMQQHSNITNWKPSETQAHWYC